MENRPRVGRGREAPRSGLAGVTGMTLRLPAAGRATRDDRDGPRVNSRAGVSRAGVRPERSVSQRMSFTPVRNGVPRVTSRPFGLAGQGEDGGLPRGCVEV